MGERLQDSLNRRLCCLSTHSSTSSHMRYFDTLDTLLPNITGTFATSKTPERQPRKSPNLLLYVYVCQISVFRECSFIESLHTCFSFIWVRRHKEVTPFDCIIKLFLI